MIDDSSNSKKININDYELIKELNKGAYGIVYLVKEKNTGKKYAAKVNIFKGNYKEYMKYVIREIEILSDASFPTIVGFHGYSTKDFDNRPYVTILLDYLENGSLLDVINKGRINNDFDNTKKHIILAGIAHGMMTLHYLSIIHRDLKPGNVLIDDEFHPRITDFGMSKYYDQENPFEQTQWGGTPLFEAPEIWNKSCYDISVDVYAFGILMYQVLTGLQPYSELNLTSIEQLKREVVDNRYRPTFTVNFQYEMKQIIESCWDEEPSKRPTFKDIYDYLSLKKGEQFLLNGSDITKVKDYISYINSHGTQANEEAMDILLKQVHSNQAAYLKLKLSNISFQILKQKKAQDFLKKAFSATLSENNNDDKGILYHLRSNELKLNPYDHFFITSLSRNDPYNVLYPKWNGFYSSSDKGGFFFELKLKYAINLTGYLIQFDETGSPKSYSIYVNDQQLRNITDEDKMMLEYHYTFVNLNNPVQCERFKFVQNGPNCIGNNIIRIKRIELFTKENSPKISDPLNSTKGLFASFSNLYKTSFNAHILPVLISADTFSCEEVQDINSNKLVCIDDPKRDFCEFKFIKGMVRVDSYRLKRAIESKLKGWKVIGINNKDAEIIISSIKENDVNEHQLIDIYQSNDKETLFKSIRIYNTTANWNGENKLIFHHFELFGDFYD